MIERMKPRTARVGIFGVGHAVYWAQFEGLLDTLLGYHSVFRELVESCEVEVLDFGMVDTNEKAWRTAQQIHSAAPDLLFCNMLTYATSSTIAPILTQTSVPIILTALQPRKRLDYQDACTLRQLENDNICAVPEFTGVAVRLGRKIQDVIIGSLYEDAQPRRAIREWCGIARVLGGLKGARFGLMGHVLESMYDMHTDPTAFSAAFGVHVPLLEVDDVIEQFETITEGEILEEEKLILECFDTPDPVNDPITAKLKPEDLYMSAKTSKALRKFVEQQRLTGLAYYYNGRKDSLHRNLVSSFIVGNSLLNAMGIPMCGEYDLKTCMAMFIMDQLNIGGSFAEFHPFDFEEDFIFVGHDGPHHIAVAEGKPVLRSLDRYHGKPGSGASVEFKIKEGPITMLGISQTYDGKYKFIIGEGMSRKGPIPPTGNTNTRGYFKPNTREFIRRWVMAGPTHHYALGVGHHAGTIAKIAQVLEIPWEIVQG